MVVFVSANHFVEYENSTGGIYVLDAFFMGVGVHVPYTVVRNGKNIKFVGIGSPHVCKHRLGHPDRSGWLGNEEDLPSKVVKAAHTFLAKKGGSCGKKHAA